MNTNETLIYVLGYLDGSREPLPLRDDAWQSDQQAKAAYAATGAIHIPNSGEDAAGRKRFIRAAESLESGGLVHRHGKRIGLTPAGDAAARRLAGLPTLEAAADLLAAIAQPDRRHRWSDGSISESSLCGLAPLPPGQIGQARTPSEELNVLLAFAAPLLCAGLIGWRPVSGLDGVLLYSAKKAGKGDAAKWYRTIKSKRQFVTPPHYQEGWQRAYAGREYARPEKPHMVCHLDVVDAPR